MKLKNLLSFSLAIVACGVMCSAAHAGSVVNNGPGNPSSSSDVTLTAQIDEFVEVFVDDSTSDLHENLTNADLTSTVDVAGDDYQIDGYVFKNNLSANVQCQLSTLQLQLVNGSDDITVNLAGSIGGTAVSTSAFSPTFTGNQATIDMQGDIDESTASVTDAPGTYSGSFTITATII